MPKPKEPTKLCSICHEQFWNVKEHMNKYHFEEFQKAIENRQICALYEQKNICPECNFYFPVFAKQMDIEQHLIEYHSYEWCIKCGKCVLDFCDCNE